MGDSNNSTKPKEGSSTQGGDEVDPNIRHPSFKPPRDLTLTKPDSVETKNKRKSSLGRPTKKSKGEKGKSSSEGMEISLRRSGRNVSSIAPALVQKVDKDDKISAKGKMSAEEKKIEKQLLEDMPVQSAQEKKTGGDKEKKDENVGDPKEEMLQEQLAEEPMEITAYVGPITEPQPKEKKTHEDAQTSTAAKEAEQKEKFTEKTVSTQTLD